MKIELLYFRGCPNYAPARAVLHQAIRLERVAAVVTDVEVQDEAMAQAIAFVGSPFDPHKRSGC